MTDLTAEIARKLLRYEPDTGKLFWRKRGPEWFENGYFRAETLCRAWNTKCAGKEILSHDNNGYLTLAFDGRRYLAHRVVLLMNDGEFPPSGVDHIDGDPSNNQLSNLRHADQVTNCRNMKRSARNTSGHTGVSPGNGKWTAQIRVDGRKIHLGTFKHKRMAIAARKLAEQEHNFHPNHGRA